MATISTLFSNGTISKTEKCFCGIYGIQNNITKKWYVGESIHVIERIKDYLGTIGSGQRVIKSAFAKYGKNNFTCYKLEECGVDELASKELYWSIKLKSMSPSGYNLKVGKNSCQVYSQESRDKMRNSQLGKTQSVESNEKRKEWASANYDKVASQLGKKQSLESNLKRSASLMGNKNNTGNKTAEQLLAYGNSNRGRKQSPEEIAKRSASLVISFSKPEVKERLRNRKRPDPIILSIKAKEDWARRKQLKETA